MSYQNKGVPAGKYGALLASLGEGACKRQYDRTEDKAMTIDTPGKSPDTLMMITDAPSLQGCGRGDALVKKKDRQSRKVRQFRDALVEAGFVTVDAQSKVLGLARSTTWAILNGKYKSSGLSATIVNRILKAPRLPSAVRARVIEYVEEKAGGLYGHNKAQSLRFIARLTGRDFGDTQLEKIMRLIPLAQTIELV